MFQTFKFDESNNLGTSIGIIYVSSEKYVLDEIRLIDF